MPKGTKSPTAVSAMTPAATHPTNRRPPEMVKRPMTRWLVAINIMRTRMGTATGPLMTADQKSARMGSNEVKVSPRPQMVAAESTP